MENIKFYYSNEDEEMKNDLIKKFGEDISFSNMYELTGVGEAIIVCIIPATALTIQIVDFILDHFVNEKKFKGENNDEEAIKKLRKFEIDGQRISFTGYSADEIKSILTTLGWKRKK